MNDEYLERFGRVVRKLPVGTHIDFMGVHAVVTGHQALPCHDAVALPHMATTRDNSGGEYFVLHASRFEADAIVEDAVVPGTMMSFSVAEDIVRHDVMRTPAEWEATSDRVVIDDDGWRGSSRLPAKSWDEPITREEWVQRMSASTTGPRRSGHRVRLLDAALKETDDAAEAVLTVMDSTDTVVFQTVVESTNDRGVSHHSQLEVRADDPDAVIAFGRAVVAMGEAVKARKGDS